MTVDANMYWIPEDLFTNEGMMEEFLRCIPSIHGVSAKCEQVEGTDKKQIIIEEPEGYQNLNYVQGEYRAEQQLKDMDAAGVEKAVLKIPCAHAWLSLEMCRKFNDGMAEHVKKGKGRFAALAAVPPQGGKEAVYELERCVKELGMTGVQLSSHYGNRYLDDELFRPFLKKVNELKLPVYIGRALALAVSLYGIYAFMTRQLWQRMFLLMDFAFFDYQEPAIYFFADYLSILILFAALSFYLAKCLRKI